VGNGELPAGTFAGDDGRLRVGTVDGVLELLEVQPPGGRPMAAADFLRGRAL
jgi:methionyl-tRNA formyltransferase